MSIFIKNLFVIIMRRLTSTIRYLIVGFDYKNGDVTFLCYGGRAFFKRNIMEAMTDNKLIGGLASEQSCFLGIVFGMWLKEKKDFFDNQRDETTLQGHFATEENIAFDRKGNLIYFDKQTNKPKVEKAYTVAASKELISKFDSFAACSIGVFVGSNLRKLQNFEILNKEISASEEKDNIVFFAEAKIRIAGGDE